ncbi:hypothetical protein J4Q44_G00393560 [Coregonus suidteri]|uniref:Uncharacterized protein n=1 Tax=Coregonus suidteri TaxID=861788 RepID=A0AAN8KGN5_9TELE
MAKLLMYSIPHVPRLRQKKAAASPVGLQVTVQHCCASLQEPDKDLSIAGVAEMESDVMDCRVVQASCPICLKMYPGRYYPKCQKVYCTGGGEYLPITRGYYRSYIEVLRRCILDEGPEGMGEKMGKNPIYSISDLDSGNVKAIGEIFSASLVQGRPSPCFMCEWCYQYIETGDMDQRPHCQIRKGLQLFELLAIIQKHSNICRELFVPGQDHAEPDADFLLSCFVPVLSGKGTCRWHLESQIMNHMQDFLKRLSRQVQLMGDSQQMRYRRKMEQVQLMGHSQQMRHRRMREKVKLMRCSQRMRCRKTSVQDQWKANDNMSE